MGKTFPSNSKFLHFSGGDITIGRNDFSPFTSTFEAILNNTLHKLMGLIWSYLWGFHFGTYHHMCKINFSN
ncbi:hypothetical protein PRUPE_7G028800 [Prunus persica]|uniref:Uncharacterized protein n=1 Tax=Prunus persica TaxID=3760 RepID=M5WB65_PRUPE|nr:hypothetical protein PRUPE_7G028800 [Prunus persica]